VLSKPWKKLLLAVAAFAIVIFWLILPASVEWYVESNSKELSGRQVLMKDLDFNILSGGVTVEQLQIFESDDSTVFIQVEELYVNIELWQSIFGTYGLGEVSVTRPQVTIVQTKAGFNFDDLLTRFAADSSQVPEEPAEPVSYRVENISLDDGTFTYRQPELQAEIKLVRINSTCPQVSSDDPKVNEQFDFAFDRGGKLKGTFLFDMEKLGYRADYELDSLNIAIFFPYIVDVMRTGQLSGLFTSHQSVSGNLNNPTAVATTGKLWMNGFSLTDPNKAKLVGLEEMVVDIDSIDMSAEIYKMRYVRVTKPYLIVELFDEGNNFSRLMREPTEETAMSSDSLAKAAAYGNVFALMAAYVRDMSRMYAFSDYHADSLVLRQGTLVFNDFTLHHRFNYLLENLLVKADKVSSADANIQVEASSILNTSGVMKGQLRVDPHGFSNMSIDYSIRGLRVSDFSPYSHYYVAHPFTDGVCYYISKTSVKNKYLNSNHVLDIKSIKVGKKEKNKTAYNVPVRLAVALLRDKNGYVHLELPIEGDLSDPKYKIGKVIWQIFGNLISKAVASPGKLLAGKAGVEEALLAGFQWKPLQTELTEDQKKSLDALVKSLETTPEIKVDLVKLFNTPMETDELALREGKKKFLFFHRRITTDDPTQPDEMAQVDQVHHNDSTFNAYLNQQVSTQGELVSVYEKSKRLTGPERLQSRLDDIYRRRTESIAAYLTTVKGVAVDRFRIAEPEADQKIAYAEESSVTFRFYVDED
jgi:hypothetical protein